MPKPTPDNLLGALQSRILELRSKMRSAENIEASARTAYERASKNRISIGSALSNVERELSDAHAAFQRSK